MTQDLPKPRRLDAKDPLVEAAMSALSPFGRQILDTDFGGVLYLEGDVELEGDLGAGRVAAWAKDAGAYTILVTGDLVVGGVIEATQGYYLIVLGDVRCQALHAGEEAWVSIAGDVFSEQAVTMSYNDTVTSIDGEVHAPVLLVSDHSTNAMPSAQTLAFDDGYDLKPALRAIADPAVLVDDWLDRAALVAHVAAGRSPLTIDVFPIRAAIEQLAGDPVAAVRALVSLDAAAFVEFHGPLQGFTPLHWLALTERRWPEGVDAGSLDVGALVRALVDAGADLEASFECYGVPNRPTPLQQAALMRSEAVAEALLEAGADVPGRSAKRETVDDLLLAALGVHYRKGQFDDAAGEHYRGVVELLGRLGFSNADELRRAVEGHLEALGAGAPDATATLRYKPLGWNERAHWSEPHAKWMVQLGDVPAQARYDEGENEWIIEGPGEEGYALQRRYYRPTNGTLACVANVPDAARPQHFDMVRYHDDGAVSMRATWHDGSWHGEKVDIPSRGETSEQFVLYTVPPNLAKAISMYDEGRMLSFEFYDHEGRAIDKYGRPA